MRPREMGIKLGLFLVQYKVIPGVEASINDLRSSHLVSFVDDKLIGICYLKKMFNVNLFVHMDA